MTELPSRTDVITAIRNPQVSYKVPELIGGSVIQKGSRVIQYSGGYTTVFPFIDRNSRKVAVRCWIADIGEAKKRTQTIANYLTGLNSSYFAGFAYVENALLVKGNLMPVVVMEWVEGDTLKEYINVHVHDSNAVLAIAEKFKSMVLYFHQNNIAHGDLQHGNIMVKKDGSLMTIDYDSMYIKDLKGMPDVIKGLPGYQHPARLNNQCVIPELDYFSELVIYLSLLVFAHEPDLWSDYYEREDLLFSREDYESYGSSKLFNKLLGVGDLGISDLTRKLIEMLEEGNISNLAPLEDMLKDKREASINNIFDKWDDQPNPPVVKKVELPSAENVFNKF